MAFDEVECEAMIAEAERAKLKLMIAYGCTSSGATCG
jgi:predicted dehydrogenase